MKQFGLMALMGVLIWFAWQMGFQQAEHPGIGFIASEQRVIHSTLDSPSFHQAALTSERFLDHSARGIQYNSVQAWDSVKPKEQQTSWHSQHSETSPSTQSGLTRVWQQAHRLIVSMQPIAKTTWSLVQSSWQNLTTDKSVDSHRPDSVASRQN